MKQDFQGNPYGFKPGKSTYTWDFLNAKWKDHRLDARDHTFILKARFEKAKDAYPSLTGEVGIEFHWFVFGDQIARKVDRDSFETLMTGTRCLLGYKKPSWRQFS